jgi:hypothetical protein
LLLVGAYMLGVYYPHWYGYAERGLEYTSVAWSTCIIILILNWFSRSSRRVPDNNRVIKNGGNASSMGPRYELQPLMPPATPTSIRDIEVQSSFPEEDLPMTNIHDPIRLMAEETAPLTPNNSFGVPDTGNLEMPHPALEPFYVINTVTCERVIPNAEEPFRLDNEYFSGHVMILIRTPNVDDFLHEFGSDANQKASQYFTGKQRRFEFQFQLKLKKVPNNQTVYFACELEEPIKLGAIQRAFVSAAMAFVKTTNSTFHYSLTGNKDGRSLEKPHMAFTVEGSMDRVVVTPPGEAPPTLGGPIHEDPESIKRRKKGGSIEWNTQDTYTLSLWSSYVDFLEWRCMNLPGIRPFQLSNIIGRQPINLTLYLLPEDRGNDRHYQQDMVSVCNLEMCNTSKMAPGPFSEAWMKRYHRLLDNGSLHEQIRSNGSFSNLSVDGDKSADGSSIDGATTPGQVMPQSLSNEELLATVEEENDDDDDANTVAELGEGIYLRSGDKVVLREVISAGDEHGGGEDEHTGGFLTNGGGFAVLQGLTSSTIVIERPHNRFRPLVNATKRELPARSQLIKSGDTVMFKLLFKGKDGETEVRYLSIHRGWWLKWVNALPTKNGNFTIYTQETEFSSNEDNDEPRLRPNETQTSYLTLGGSFWLRHKRWSKFKVGIAAEESPTFGGRILGLYSTQPTDSPGESRNNGSDDDEFDFEETEMNVKRKNEWMRPLQLCAYEASSIHSLLPTMKGTVNAQQAFIGASNSDHSLQQDGVPSRFLFAEKEYRLDVPAWIEMMNRTERRRQLAYVVRVLPTEQRSRKNSADSESPEDVSPSEDAFSRLRTGRDLAQIMRVGLSWRRSVDAHVSPDKRFNRRSSWDSFHTPK